MSKQVGAAARHHRALQHTRRLCLAAMLTALSFLLGWLAKTIQGAGPLRFTIEGMPIVLAGISLGPFFGALVGVAADLLSCLLAGQAPLPLITVGAALVGLLPGLLCINRYRPTVMPPRYPCLLILEGITHLIASIGVKTAALIQFYDLHAIILWRGPLYIGVALLESYLLYLLLRSPTVRRELERLLK